MAVIRTVILLLVVTGGLSGCGSLLVSGAPAWGNDSADDARDAGQIAADERITAAINRKYVGDNLISALDIKVSTYRRVVTLSGSVRSAAVAQRAVALARDTGNVSKVNSRLRIQP
jgi:hyperosmotically inducible protein